MCKLRLGVGVSPAESVLTPIFHRVMVLLSICLSMAAWARPVAAVEVQQAQIDNRRCLDCHGQSRMAELSPGERGTMVASAVIDQDAPATRPGLYIGPEALSKSVHQSVTCLSCHAQATTLPHPAKMGPVNCSNATCHVEQGVAFRRSTHAAVLAKGEAEAPTCATCHGGHDIRSKSDRESRVYPLNIVKICAGCHEKHQGGVRGQTDAVMVNNYLESVHGRAIQKGGLIVAATCADCHHSHDVLPAENPQSSVFRDNVPATCGKCHVGVEEVFAASIHGKLLASGDPNAPVCTNCHTAHRISASNTPSFQKDIVNECGACHDKPLKGGTDGRSLYATYRRSYHGQVTQLGSDRAARCSDCHGAHDVLELENPQSRLFGANRVATCAQKNCHPGANANFAKFEPHADFRDGDRFPLLHAVWLYFMLVMSATFGFFGLHTLLWFIRASIQHYRHPPQKHAAPTHGIKRFNKVDRINHALIIVSFFGLTLTGMPLFFSDQAWAKALATLFGGPGGAGVLHRIFALMLIGNFVVHGAGVIRRIRRHSLKTILFGPNSLLPRFKDVTDALGMMRWFFGGKKMPRFDHWVYWEKFDYWAEIFGTSVIGFTGLMLWFPLFFSKFMPGWFFNIATVIHGYEALLAVGFIFTIHFFNAHLRPEKFPVDAVMFTGSMPEEELKHERPEEYERLVKSGELERLRVPAPPPWQRYVAVTAGILAMLIGTTMVVLIILAGLEALR